MFRLFWVIGLATTLLGQPLSYDPNPMGSIKQPLILRTYLPDPGLEPAVLAHHHRASKSPKYSPREGNDLPGEYEMIQTIPAGIAVNHGPALSYVFDTTECRLLYAWQGGFLDMFPYWGEQDGGRRRSFDYVPRLVGNLFHLAEPLERTSPQPPRFLGYDIREGVPTFHYQKNKISYQLRIEPDDSRPLSFQQILTTGDQVEVSIVTGEILSQHSGFERELKFKEANVDAGEQVFLAYGCIACHSTDGSRGHGPTLAELYGNTRQLANGESVLVDESYLRESILTPNAKTAAGFPPNYMPPYQMKEKELQALLLFIQSLSPAATSE